MGGRQGEWVPTIPITQAHSQAWLTQLSTPRTHVVGTVDVGTQLDERERGVQLARGARPVQRRSLQNNSTGIFSRVSIWLLEIQ